jgi:hypothetical protein
MKLQNYNPILKPHVESFKASGTLAGEGNRQTIPAEAVPQVKAQLTQQMDQVILADNTTEDQNPELGKVTQKQEDFGLSVSAEFEGNTSKGRVALDVEAPGIASSAYAEFTETGALVIQSISNGGEPGFVGVHLDYNGGESYAETLNVPDGTSIGL